MTDLLGVLGVADSHGLGLVLLGWILWEVRRIGRNFSRHKHDGRGRVMIVAHED